MIQPLDQVRSIVAPALSETTKVRKNFEKFFILTMSLILTIYDGLDADDFACKISGWRRNRICHGSRMRYDNQYMKYSALSTDIPELKRLISVIHKYRRCYDQEGYINNHSTATTPLQ